MTGSRRVPRPRGRRRGCRSCPFRPWPRPTSTPAPDVVSWRTRASWSSPSAAPRGPFRNDGLDDVGSGDTDTRIGPGDGALDDTLFERKQLRGRVAGLVGIGRDQPAVEATDDVVVAEALGGVDDGHHRGRVEKVVGQGLDALPGGTVGVVLGDRPQDIAPGEGRRLLGEACGPGQVLVELVHVTAAKDRGPVTAERV